MNLRVEVDDQSESESYCEVSEDNDSIKDSVNISNQTEAYSFKNIESKASQFKRSFGNKSLDEFLQAIKIPRVQHK